MDQIVSRSTLSGPHLQTLLSSLAPRTFPLTLWGPANGYTVALFFECNTSYTADIVTKNTGKPILSQGWLLLIHQLPAKPTNLRVRIWRKLQKLGAVSIKNSVYILPANDKTNEDFQWLKQEIEAAGGEAAVFRANSVAGATDKEIIETFRKARDEEFAEISASLDALTGSVREQTKAKHLSAGRLASHEAELERLHAELERVVSNDFFGARGRASAVTAYGRSQKVIRSSQTPAIKTSPSLGKRNQLSVEDYQGRRWVTRRNIHIDRLASAWLIKQFIDKHPRFYFVPQGEKVENAIPFDMFGAEFTHQGEDCTFETLLKRFGLNDVKGLRDLAEIVHDIDLKDDKFQRLEAGGVKALVDGLSETIPDDRKRLQQASVIFDGLFRLLDKQSTTKQRRNPAKRKVSRKK